MESDIPNVRPSAATAAEPTPYRANVQDQTEAGEEVYPLSASFGMGNSSHRQRISSKGSRHRWYLLCKRGCDLVGAFFLLLLLAIPMLLIGAAVFLDSGAPILFRQKRMGKGKRSFTCLKFRTMYCSAPPSCKTEELQEPKRYITRVGAFLRKTSLDELPQLYNVLLGTMSLVGPRPVILSEERLLALRHAEQAEDAKPGITGLSQISGRDLLTDEEKAHLDGIYARTACLSLDLAICFRTVRCVLSQSGIREGAPNADVPPPPSSDAKASAPLRESAGETETSERTAVTELLPS